LKAKEAAKKERQAEAAADMKKLEETVKNQTQAAN